MKPTRVSVLVVAAVVAAVVTRLLMPGIYGDLPPLPRFAPLTLAILAIVEGQQAASVRSRLAGRPRTRPVLPLVVVRLAALAKASSPVGAVVAGLYAGAFAYTLELRDTLAAADEDAITAGLGLAAAAALTVCAVLLESACRTPDLPDDDRGLDSTDE